MDPFLAKAVVFAKKCNQASTSQESYNLSTYLKDCKAISDKKIV
jgi:hypothetical protein